MLAYFAPSGQFIGGAFVLLQTFCPYWDMVHEGFMFATNILSLSGQGTLGFMFATNVLSLLGQCTLGFMFATNVLSLSGQRYIGVWFCYKHVVPIGTISMVVYVFLQTLNKP